MSEPYTYPREGVSNCCSAVVYGDSDICTHCGEHCAIMIPCPKCGGDGYIEVIDHSRVYSITIDPPYERLTCEGCYGMGEVEG